MRVRGTVIAISTCFAIVSLYVIIDQRPNASVAAADSATESIASDAAEAQPIPIDNRLCGLAQRLVNSLAQEGPAVALAMQDFYTEAATFTDGDLRGDLKAAARYYTEVNAIANKANWDVNVIVRNNDGLRWKALLTGTATGVEESRADIRDRCRTNLPDPPSIEVDSYGRIRDPRLARLLAPLDREIYRPPPEPDPPDTTLE
jgi:hypothetical protein